jgi:D-alanine transaminase
MKSVGYYNGKIGLVEELKIPMTDRAMFFGDGVYDVTIGVNHKMFAIEDHVDRFYNSLKLLEIPFEMSMKELKKELQKCVDLMDSNENLLIYWQSTRGTGKRMHVFPETKPTLMITITELDKLDIFTPIKLITMEDTRFLHCNIKTLNLIPSVIASQRAKEAGCQEAVLQRQNIVTECAHSNIAILKDGTFITTPLSNLILPGITRKHLIELCKENDIMVVEREMKLEEIFEADEIIVTSASKLCTSANEIDGKTVGNKAHELLEKLQNAYIAKFEQELGEKFL